MIEGLWKIGIAVAVVVFILSNSIKAKALLCELHRWSWCDDGPPPPPAGHACWITHPHQAPIRVPLSNKGDSRWECTLAPVSTNPGRHPQREVLVVELPFSAPATQVRNDQRASVDGWRMALPPDPKRIRLVEQRPANSCADAGRRLASRTERGDKAVVIPIACALERGRLARLLRIESADGNVEVEFR